MGWKNGRSHAEKISAIGRASTACAVLLIPATTSERTSGGYFLDFRWNRDELARYGLSIENAQEVKTSAIGGENVTTIIQGRERYPVNVRYLRDYRSDPDKLGRVLVPTADGQSQVPLAQLAQIRTVSGPAMLRD